MECKVWIVLIKVQYFSYWNISRMECKEMSMLWSSIFWKIIGIYPEWNVKKSDVKANHKNITIGIYPEWNVKVSTSITSKPFTSLEYIQNGM